MAEKIFLMQKLSKQPRKPMLLTSYLDCLMWVHELFSSRRTKGPFKLVSHFWHGEHGNLSYTITSQNTHSLQQLSVRGLSARYCTFVWLPSKDLCLSLEKKSWCLNSGERKLHSCITIHTDFTWHGKSWALKEKIQKSKALSGAACICSRRWGRKVN